MILMNFFLIPKRHDCDEVTYITFLPKNRNNQQQKKEVNESEIKFPMGVFLNNNNN